MLTDPPTKTQTHKHTDRTDYNTLRCSLAHNVITVKSLVKIAEFRWGHKISGVSSALDSSTTGKPWKNPCILKETTYNGKLCDNNFKTPLLSIELHIASVVIASVSVVSCQNRIVTGHHRFVLLRLCLVVSLVETPGSTVEEPSSSSAVATTTY